MYGYIYKTTNLINGKIYVGQKMSTVFLKEEYLGSGRYLNNAINKYGRENFKVELIEWCENSEILNEREKYWIAYFNCQNHEIGYNIADGGEGGNTWKGLSEIDKLERYNRYKQSYENNPSNRGKKRINNGNVDKYVLIEDLQEFLNNGWYLGSCHPSMEISDLHKQTLSEKHKGRIFIHLNDKMKQIYPNELEEYLQNGWQKGKPEYIKALISKANKNKEFTEEMRKNMSIAHLNSNQKTQKGYKTINNGIEEKHVPKEILNKYLNDGWILGRLPITEEHRKNLSNANKGQIPWCKGFKYITNGKEEKRVSPQEIQKYLDLGWWIGRLPLDKR